MHKIGGHSRQSIKTLETNYVIKNRGDYLNRCSTYLETKMTLEVFGQLKKQNEIYYIISKNSPPHSMHFFILWNHLENASRVSFRITTNSDINSTTAAFEKENASPRSFFAVSERKKSECNIPKTRLFEYSHYCGQSSVSKFFVYVLSVLLNILLFILRYPLFLQTNCGDMTIGRKKHATIFMLTLHGRLLIGGILSFSNTQTVD